MPVRSLYPRLLRNAMTDAEVKLWNVLRCRAFGVKFRRQHPLGSYVVDFVCLEQGFRVLRFWNHEVLGNLDGVLSKLISELGAS
ncbi:MAG TPA: hypothetical protein DD435_09825 [Cyanobacteria bacterium UBA8530]|nr:hypothetical protein [Cyanobacteria bacterium UBA8530]